MPVQSCSKNGKSGFKYGNSGFCYTGPGAKEKAHKQGVAIELSKKRAGKHSEFANKKESLLETIQRILLDRS